MKKKLIRITTIPNSMTSLLNGQLKFMSEYYDVTAISSSFDGFLEKQVKSDGVKVLPIEMTRQITPLKDIRATWKLYRFFRKEKPFIVHTHTPKAGTLGMLAAYLAGVPNRLHTIAGLPLLEATGVKRRILNFVERLTYRFATKVYPNSLGLFNIALANKFAPVSKLKVIGLGSSNGIDLTHFDPESFSDSDKSRLHETMNIKKDDFVFIFVGRLVQDKGIQELITAFERISKKYSNVKLVLVGPFEKHLDPLDINTEKSITDHPSIIYVGKQADVRPFFAISDLLVFPSYREGFPNVVMESGAMSLPAIVTDINGCNEIVTHERNGLIVPVKDSESLHNAMLELFLNEEKRLKLASKSREMIKSRYERNFIWEEILNEYQLL